MAYMNDYYIKKFRLYREEHIFVSHHPWHISVKKELRINKYLLEYHMFFKKVPMMDVRYIRIICRRI